MPHPMLNIAVRAARAAGSVISRSRDRVNDLTIESKKRNDFVSEVDHQAEAAIIDTLRRAYPDHAILAEETGASGEDNAEFRWIIDPLDGTREFAEAGRHDWAVHVALWEDDHFLAGAVALPALGAVLTMDPPPALPDTGGRERPRLVTSRTRAPYAAAVVAQELGCDAVRLGSAGAKAMAVVLGEADIYLHDGGMYQWDSAAPAAVALAAGLHVSRIDGSPIVYNDPDPWLPDFIVCRPELATAVLTALWGVDPR